MPISAPDLTAPIQESGSYRAWSLDPSGAAPFDLAWHSRAGHGASEAQHLLPFTEPSIAIRRRYSEDGATLDWDFVVFKAQPDGGAYDPQSGEELFALRFAPEMMESAFALKASEFMTEDREVPGCLRDRLSDAAHLADGGDFRSAWSAMHHGLRQIAGESEIDRVSRAASLARRSRGAIGPALLAEQTGLSLRHLRRCFVDRLGLSPRALLRRQRLTSAMLDAERAARRGWADVAAGHNFSDQAHMVRECRALIGKSPGEWHRERRRMAVSFNT